MPKATSTPAEKAQAALDAANTRVDRKQSQYDTSKALTERLASELDEAKQTRDYAAKHPALAKEDASVDQGDVEDDATDEDPFA
jgi:hypothetical protein